VRWDGIPANPADKTIRPVASRQERQWWTREQCPALLTLTDKSAWWPLWALTLATGYRLGELTGLRWSDVDDERKSIRIERSGSWIGNQWVESSPKTTSGRRTLSMNELTRVALRRQKVQQAAWRLKAGQVWQD
jgi:integrase